MRNSAFVMAAGIAIASSSATAQTPDIWTYCKDPHPQVRLAACSVIIESGHETGKALADAYISASKRPWTQPIGFQHALFEVAIDVLKRAKTLEPKEVLNAIVATDYSSIVGPVKWTGRPVKNVTKTPLVAGQWQRIGDKFELVITANKTAPEIPVGGKLNLLG